MAEIPASVLFGILFLLLLLSAFFSSSETGLMTLNRYRLRNLAKANHRSAQVTEELLKRPDRLIGLILLGNNLVNVLAAQIVTILALQLYGDYAIAIAGGIFTLVVLVFAEVLPKTIAALRPETIAFPAAWVYRIISKPLWPLVWAVNGITTLVLRIFGLKVDEGNSFDALSREELRTVVAETGAIVSRKYQKMLLNILDLEGITVEDIMVPRSEIIGIDLEDDLDEILEQITSSQHTRLPIFEESIDSIIGVIHLRRLLPLINRNELDKDSLRAMAREPLFIPEGTTLSRQLGQLQLKKRRVGLVVDEYGDIQGLVTLEDILEEIVGEFTTDPAEMERDVFPQEDGSHLVDGSVHLRDLNRALKLNLPTENAKTLNGLLTDYLETIPETGTSVLINGYPMEIVQTTENRIVTVRIGKKIKSR